MGWIAISEDKIKINKLNPSSRHRRTLPSTKFKIVFHGKSYKCHRLVVCLQSDWSWKLFPKFRWKTLFQNCFLKFRKLFIDFLIPFMAKLKFVEKWLFIIYLWKNHLLEHEFKGLDNQVGWFPEKSILPSFPFPKFSYYYL